MSSTAEDSVKDWKTFWKHYQEACDVCVDEKEKNKQSQFQTIRERDKQKKTLTLADTDRWQLISSLKNEKGEALAESYLTDLKNIINPLLGSNLEKAKIEGKVFLSKLDEYFQSVFNLLQENKPLKKALKNKQISEHELYNLMVDLFCQQYLAEDAKIIRAFIQSQHKKDYFSQRKGGWYYTKKGLAYFGSLTTAVLSALSLIVLFSPYGIAASLAIGFIFGSITLGLNLFQLTRSNKTDDELKAAHPSRLTYQLYRGAEGVTYTSLMALSVVSIVAFMGVGFTFWPITLGVIAGIGAVFFYKRVLDKVANKYFSEFREGKENDEEDPSNYTLKSQIDFTKCSEKLENHQLDKGYDLKILIDHEIQKATKGDTTLNENHLKQVIEKTYQALLSHQQLLEVVDPDYTRPRKLDIYNDAVELVIKSALNEANPQELISRYKKNQPTENKALTFALALGVSIMGSILPAVAMATFIPPPFGIIAGAAYFCSSVITDLFLLRAAAKQIEIHEYDVEDPLEEGSFLQDRLANLLTLTYASGNAAGRYISFYELGIQSLKIPVVGIIVCSVLIGMGSFAKSMILTRNFFQDLFKRDKIPTQNPKPQVEDKEMESGVRETMVAENRKKVATIESGLHGDTDLLLAQRKAGYQSISTVDLDEDINASTNIEEMLQGRSNSMIEDGGYAPSPVSIVDEMTEEDRAPRVNKLEETLGLGEEPRVKNDDALPTRSYPGLTFFINPKTTTQDEAEPSLTESPMLLCDR